MRSVSSPNHSPRTSPVRAVVVHYTGAGSFEGSVRWLCDPASKASAHFAISRDGEIVQLVPLDRRAWHAGLSEIVIDGKTISNVNDCSIGIELANHGLVYNGDDGKFWYSLGSDMYPYRGNQPEFGTLRWAGGHEIEGWFEPYPDPQIKALVSLLDELRREGYPTENLIGHEEIALPIGRKLDPGPLFPWHLFSRAIERRTQGR